MGAEGHGISQIGKAGKARSGEAGLGRARRGTERQGRHGAERSVEEGLGQYRSGKDRQAKNSKPKQRRISMDSIKARVQQEVNSIYQENGNVRPTTLIERAKPKDSPIHDAFEWDNKKAGHEFRLIQARRWIRVSAPDIKNPEIKDRYVHIPSISNPDDVCGEREREGYYKPISILKRGSTEYELAHSYLLSKLNSAKEAYHEFRKVAEKENDPQVKFDDIDKGFKMIENAMPRISAM